MAVEIVEYVPGGEGGWFKPPQYERSIALLVEPQDKELYVDEQDNKEKLRVIAQVTVFNDHVQLDEADPAEVLEDVMIGQQVLAKEAAKLIGKGFIVTVGQPSGKRYYIWKPVSPDVQGKVVEYIEAREAEAEDLFGDD